MARPLGDAGVLIWPRNCRHPDKNQNSQESTDKFKLINAAYARLSSLAESDDDFEDLDPSELFTEDLFRDMGVDFFSV